MIKKWIKACNTFGDDGLIRKINKQKYTFDFKLFVVKLYLKTETSYQELALKVGINEPSLITRWVNDFKVLGSNEFREKIKRRKPKIPNQSNNNEIKSRFICKLQRLFQLKDIFAVLKFPKSTYLYWQKIFDTKNPNKELEEKILKI